MGKHRDKLEQELVMRGFSRATCECYVRHAKAFVSHFGRSADELGTEHVRSWVLWLLTVRKLDAATVNVAIAALRKFLRSGKSLALMAAEVTERGAEDAAP